MSSAAIPVNAAKGRKHNQAQRWPLQPCGSGVDTNRGVTQHSMHTVILMPRPCRGTGEAVGAVRVRTGMIRCTTEPSSGHTTKAKHSDAQQGTAGHSAAQRAHHAHNVQELSALQGLQR